MIFICSYTTFIEIPCGLITKMPNYMQRPLVTRSTGAWFTTWWKAHHKQEPGSRGKSNSNRPQPSTTLNVNAIENSREEFALFSLMKITAAPWANKQYFHRVAITRRSFSSRCLFVMNLNINFADTNSCKRMTRFFSRKRVMSLASGTRTRSKFN